MEAGIEQPPPQQPAQQEPQPSLHNEADSSLSAEGTNGAAQPPSPDSAPPPLFPSESDTASLASIPSGAASEQEDQVISPSVSSPPYWTHSHATSQPQNHLLQTPTSGSGHGHTRAVSSASVESVLPPGAITLQDNEREDDDDDGGNGEREYTGRRSNSSELYGRDRNKACWARSVQVTDYVLVNGSTTNLGACVVWVIGVETLNVSCDLLSFFNGLFYSLRFSFFLFLSLGAGKKKRRKG
jgi:hypothetical protein